MTTNTATRSATRGVLYVHSAPSALCPHVEWAVGGVLGAPVNLDWTPQPAQSGSYRAELSWTGGAGTAAAVASALRGWNHLRFEITEEPTPGTEGSRYSYTPELGVFHAVTGLHGDILIPEDRLKAAVVKAVTFGLISHDQAKDHYNLSDEELLEWVKAATEHGEDALKVTRVQKYRQP